MAGTKHFTRMHYHVSRGLREIVAPRQTMPNKEWDEIEAFFDNKCSYCGEGPTKENRGIVADHVVPAADYGEFVIGNIIPACQTCNDSRGNKCWREFIKNTQSPNLLDRIDKIDRYLKANPYTAPTPEVALTAGELDQYEKLQKLWKAIHKEAKALYNSKYNV